MTLPSIGAQEEREIILPIHLEEALKHDETHIRLRYVEPMNTLYANEGHLITSESFLLEATKVTKVVEKDSHNQGETFNVQESQTQLILENKMVKTVFSKVHGVLASYQLNGEEIIEKGPELTLWRAVIDNDMYKKDDWINKYFLKNAKEQLMSFTYQVNEGFADIEIKKYISSVNQAWGFELHYHYQLTQNGELNLKLTGRKVIRGKDIPEMLPRIGIQMHLNKEYNDVTWYGRGDSETYQDSKRSQPIGLYSKHVEEMHTDYVYPQENGSRC